MLVKRPLMIDGDTVLTGFKEAECKDVVGPQLFWFNGREHILHFLLYIPASVVLALLCTGIGVLM